MSSYPHKPRKKFGQNFLTQPAIVDRIVNAIDPQPGERLIEIGPGQAAMTLPVLQRVGALTALEIDEDLLPICQARCAGQGDLNLIHTDALAFDFSQLAGDAKIRVIGNLPYNISTPLIFHILRSVAVIQDMHFMLQKEVVDRMVASPGSKTYGRLSVMVQYACQVEKCFDVPPTAFHPPPKVDSSIVRLVPQALQPQAENVEQFAALVAMAFQHRRKMLRASLKTLVPDRVWEQVGIAPTLRPEQLSVVDFVSLSNAAA